MHRNATEIKETHPEDHQDCVQGDSLLPQRNTAEPSDQGFEQECTIDVHPGRVPGRSRTNYALQFSVNFAQR